MKGKQKYKVIHGAIRAKSKGIHNPHAKHFRVKPTENVNLCPMLRIPLIKIMH